MQLQIINQNLLNKIKCIANRSYHDFRRPNYCRREFAVVNATAQTCHSNTTQ